MGEEIEDGLGSMLSTAMVSVREREREEEKKELKRHQDKEANR